jgi:hypothetical protein
MSLLRCVTGRLLIAGRWLFRWIKSIEHGGGFGYELGGDRVMDDEFRKLSEELGIKWREAPVFTVCETMKSPCTHDYQSINTVHWLRCTKCGDRVSREELESNDKR